MRLRIVCVLVLIAFLGCVPGTGRPQGVSTWSCSDFSRLSEEQRRGVSLGYAMGWVAAAGMTTELGSSLGQEDVRKAGQAVHAIAVGISNDRLYERVQRNCAESGDTRLLTVIRGALVDIAKERRTAEPQNP